MKKKVYPIGGDLIAPKMVCKKSNKNQKIVAGGSANQLRREYFKNKNRKFTSVANN